MSGIGPITTPPQSPVITQQTIDTLETVATGYFSDLATQGPTLSVVVPASGRIRVGIHADISAGGIMSCRLSGANTVVCGAGLMPLVYASVAFYGGDVAFVDGLTPGATQVQCQYETAGASSTFQMRGLWVELLP